MHVRVVKRNMFFAIANRSSLLLWKVSLFLNPCWRRQGRTCSGIVMLKKFVVSLYVTSTSLPKRPWHWQWNKLASNNSTLDSCSVFLLPFDIAGTLPVQAGCCLTMWGQDPPESCNAGDNQEASPRATDEAAADAAGLPKCIHGRRSNPVPQGGGKTGRWLLYG